MHDMTLLSSFKSSFVILLPSQSAAILRLLEGVVLVNEESALYTGRGVPTRPGCYMVSMVSKHQLYGKLSH